MTLLENGNWLPLMFAGLIGLAVLIYAILDGYDLGVGILMRSASASEQDNMIASIGPFWDANETWLVLGIGLLLVAFPTAYSFVLTKLYLPFTIMIISLMVRGVAFDFRSKAKINHKKAWNTAFFAGSLLTALSQGYILGAYILGFQPGVGAIAFSLLVSMSVAAAYSLIGSAWLIMKSEGELQKKAVHWSEISLFLTLLGIILISIATPLLSVRIFHSWFVLPNVVLLAPLLFVTIALIIALHVFLRKLPKPNDQQCWVPFVATVGIFILCFHGLAYSFYPYIIPDQETIFDTITSKESLKFMLIGAGVVFPLLISYTVFAYKVFHGKTRELTYDL
ncbi:MAG: cytochrome d ubiquinol oxidase subunit II [Legionellaceae bacterium]|nr:cytochrome d ubiquinol oxidase subunit II [Legionellaceae bacterium]